jgi:hypothetical protein
MVTHIPWVFLAVSPFLLDREVIHDYYFVTLAPFPYFGCYSHQTRDITASPLVTFTAGFVRYLYLHTRF